jgi:hypothetical protein
VLLTAKNSGNLTMKNQEKRQGNDAEEAVHRP